MMSKHLLRPTLETAPFRLFSRALLKSSWQRIFVLQCCKTSTKAVTVKPQPDSWVRKGGVTPVFEAGHKLRPVAYSERRMKRAYTFPDSPINDVFLNFFLGKCVYDHCFPYHILTKDQYLEFSHRLAKLKSSLQEANAFSQTDEVLSALRQAGLLGIRTKIELGGMGVTLEKEFLRFTECILEVTECPKIIRHVIAQNVVQMCVDKFILDRDVSDNLQTLMNEKLSVQLIKGEGAIESRGSHWYVSGKAKLESNVDLVETPELFLCVMKDQKTGKHRAFITPCSGKEGVSWNNESTVLKFSNCEISVELTVEDGDDLMEAFETQFALSQCAVISSWAKRVASDALLDLSRRRRYGYRMILFQNIMAQIEEIESLCYVVETLPYFSASRMDRARIRFKQDPPKMISEVRSCQVSQHKYVTSLCKQLSKLLGPISIENQSFMNFCDYVDNHAFTNIHYLKRQIAHDGMKLYVESLDNKELQIPLKQKLRRFYFNNFLAFTSSAIESMLSDPIMLFVHHNFVNNANEIDRQVYKMFNVLKAATKERPQLFHKDPFVISLITDFALNTHLLIALIARASRSIFAGNKHYNHENRFVEKRVNDLLKENLNLYGQWFIPGAFDASSKVAESSKTEGNLNVIDWTQIQTSGNYETDEQVTENLKKSL